MAIVNFPSNPSIGDQYNENGITYTWNGAAWTANGAENTDARYVQVTGDTMTGSLNVPSINSGHAGPNNLLINGAMAVAQRSPDELNNLQSAGGLTYQTLDRWGNWSNAPNLFSANQVEDAPPGFYHSVQLKALGNNSMGTGGYNTWSQRIEAQNLYDTGIGTANAKDLTLSFWVKASTAGTYALYAMNSDYNYTYTTTYTVDVANTWEYKTITITGPTSNFNSTGNARQLEIGFVLGAGTTYTTSTLNQWQSGNYLIGATGAIDLVATINETLNITGVQLTATDTDIAFQHEDYDTTLRKCQRYYQKLHFNSVAYENICFLSVPGSTTNSSGEGVLNWITELRTSPQVTMSNGPTFRWNAGGLNDQACSSVSVPRAGRFTCAISAVDATSRTRNSGACGWLSRENLEDCWVAGEAEL